MSRTGPRKLLILTSATLAAVIVAAIGVAAQRGRPSSAVPEISTATLALDLPPGVRATGVDYVVTSASGVTLTQGTLPLDATGVPVARQVALPVGTGHVVAFTFRAATGQAGGANAAVPPIVKTFDVLSGRDTPVHAGAAVAGPPADAASTGPLAKIDPKALTAAIATPNVGRDALTSCQACQRANPTGKCDPPFLTATSDRDPVSGEYTAIGWGCSTLSSDLERRACSALLRCLNAHDCSHPQSPVMPCYCGGADATACITGNDVDGACAPEYQAAAVVGAGSAGAGATVAQISRVIATAASDPTTAVGLASNLRQCAGQARCTACEQL